MSNETIVELDLGVVPEAAISGGLLLQTEVSTFLTFNAMKPTQDGRFAQAGTAIVGFRGCLQTKFGYPNDEAWSRIPETKNLVYGVYEVHNSEWLKQLCELNRFAFPDFPGWNARHFLFLFHDSSFQCLAHDLSIEVSNEPYQAILNKLSTKVLSE